MANEGQNKTVEFDADELLLLGELISEAFGDADNDEDAADLSALHMKLGFDALVSEDSEE